MKNQYFGDINDYRKYGLIQILTMNPMVPTTVCWMLTPEDNKTDGGKTEYLNNPAKWRNKGHEELFDALFDFVIVKKQRHVSQIENSGVLPSCNFFSKEIKSNTKVERENYFAELDSYLENANDKRENSDTKMIFFDPDNGIESPKAKPNRKKYIYWSEIEKYFKEKKKSILIYQHFSREDRKQFIINTEKQLLDKTDASKIYTFKTSNVVFFLAPYNGHDTEFEFEKKASVIKHIWGD